MKKREKQALRQKSEPELRKLVGDYRKKLKELEFNLAAGKVKNVAELRETRKAIARALTFLRESSVAAPAGTPNE